MSREEYNELTQSIQFSYLNKSMTELDESKESTPFYKDFLGNLSDQNVIQSFQIHNEINKIECTIKDLCFLLNIVHYCMVDSIHYPKFLLNILKKIKNNNTETRQYLSSHVRDSRIELFLMCKCENAAASVAASSSASFSTSLHGFYDFHNSNDILFSSIYSDFVEMFIYHVHPIHSIYYCNKNYLLYLIQTCVRLNAVQILEYIQPFLKKEELFNDPHNFRFLCAGTKTNEFLRMYSLLTKYVLVDIYKEEHAMHCKSICQSIFLFCDNIEIFEFCILQFRHFLWNVCFSPKYLTFLREFFPNKLLLNNKQDEEVRKRNFSFLLSSCKDILSEFISNKNDEDEEDDEDDNNKDKNDRKKKKKKKNKNNDCITKNILPIIYHLLVNTKSNIEASQLFRFLFDHSNIDLVYITRYLLLYLRESNYDIEELNYFDQRIQERQQKREEKDEEENEEENEEEKYDHEWKMHKLQILLVMSIFAFTSTNFISTITSTSTSTSTTTSTTTSNDNTDDDDNSQASCQNHRLMKMFHWLLSHTELTKSMVTNIPEIGSTFRNHFDFLKSYYYFSYFPKNLNYKHEIPWLSHIMGLLSHRVYHIVGTTWFENNLSNSLSLTTVWNYVIKPNLDLDKNV